jgi:hypothetical protein
VNQNDSARFGNNEEDKSPPMVHNNNQKSSFQNPNKIK